MKPFKKIILLFLIILPYLLAGQGRKRIEIEHADFMRDNEAIVANAHRLIGNVHIRHNNIQMWCDSAWSYTNINMVDGFGNVHILKDDTLNLYSDFVNYNGDTKWAKARDNVKLENKGTVLTTDTLNYDMNRGIGYYDHYGTIVDSTTTLYSRIGEYYVDLDRAYFKTEVEVVAPDYTLQSDTLIYEMSTGVASIVGPTNIFDEKNNLFAIDGFYNTRTGKVDLFRRPVITSESRVIIADTIFFDKITGNGLALGDADIHNPDDKMIVKGNRALYNDLENTSLVTDSAQVWFYSPKDTLFLHADTLKTFPDTIPDEKIILAYFNARFFRTDLQGKCDSLAYWSRDSTVQMFHEPVLWSDNNQMTADYIELITQDSINQTIIMQGQAFIIAMEDSLKFNQIKGREMTGYIRNQDLYRIFVNGNGQSLYYARDDNGIIGLNRAESSSIMIYLVESKVNKIVFITSPEGTMVPILQLVEDEKTLPDFVWLDNIRPRSHADIFRRTPLKAPQKQGAGRQVSDKF